MVYSNFFFNNISDISCFIDRGNFNKLNPMRLAEGLLNISRWGSNSTDVCVVMKIGRGLISYVRRNILFNLLILALSMSGRDLVLLLFRIVLVVCIG